MSPVCSQPSLSIVDAVASLLFKYSENVDTFNSENIREEIIYFTEICDELR